MKLTGRVMKITDLTDDDINQMFNLMQENYNKFSRDVFLNDLSEKDQVILMENINGVKGFSTQMQFEHTIDGKKVIIVFSGDTIIDKSCWGTLVLPVAFGQMMLNIKARLS